MNFTFMKGTNIKYGRYKYKPHFRLLIENVIIANTHNDNIYSIPLTVRLNFTKAKDGNHPPYFD